MKFLAFLSAAAALSLKKADSQDLLEPLNDAHPNWNAALLQTGTQTGVIPGDFTIALGVAARATKVSLKIIAVYQNANQVPEFVEQLKDLVQATQAFQQVTGGARDFTLPDYYQRRVLSVTSKLLDSSRRIEGIEKMLNDDGWGSKISRGFSSLVQGLGGASTDATVDALSAVLSTATDEVRLLVRDLADERVLSNASGSGSMLLPDDSEVDAGSVFVTQILSAVADSAARSGDNGDAPETDDAVSAALTESTLAPGAMNKGQILFQLDRCIDTIETVSASLGASSTQNKFVTSFRSRGGDAINRLRLLKRWVDNATDRALRSQEMLQIFITAHRCYTGLVNVAATSAEQRRGLATLSKEDMEARSSTKALCEQRERMIDSLQQRYHLTRSDPRLAAARLDSVNAPSHCAECQWVEHRLECPVGLVEVWSSSVAGWFRYCCRKHQCTVETLHRGDTPELGQKWVRLREHKDCTQRCGQDELPADTPHGDPGTKFKDLKLTSSCPNLARLDESTWRLLLEKHEDFGDAMEAVGLHSVVEIFHNRDGREILLGAWKMMRDEVLTSQNLDDAIRFLTSEKFAEQVAPQLASLGEDHHYEVELLESLHQVLTIKRAVISFLDQPAHQRLAIRMERIDSALDFAQSLMVLQRAFELSQAVRMGRMAPM